MATRPHQLCLFSVAAAGVLLLSAGPSLGQSDVPCSAFARHAHGWRVTAPVMLDINGSPFGPMVGSTLAVGSDTSGSKLTELLDRECRSR